MVVGVVDHTIDKFVVKKLLELLAVVRAAVLAGSHFLAPRLGGFTAIGG